MKKEALAVLKNRRSIRRFKPEQVSQEVLDQVLEAGTYAPTAAGTQAPVIVAVQDPETVALLDQMNAAVLRAPQVPHPYYGAPTILLVLAPKDGMLPQVDASLVGSNLLHAAYALDLGSCWIHRSAEMFESEQGQALLQKWGLENMMGVCSIALGYPDGPHPEPAPRKAGYILKV